MVSEAKKLTATQRDALVQAIIDKYKVDPGAIEQLLPEVIPILRRILPPSQRRQPRYFPLTLAEEGN